MKEDEREALAVRTAGIVIHALRTDKKASWIQPEEHYNHHKRLSGWFGTVDRISKQVGKAFVGFVLAGIVALIIFGYNKLKF